MTADIKIVEADDKNILDFTSLFHRFFEEEGFSNTKEAIAANIEVMRHNEKCWIAAAMHDGQIVGAVTVTSMLYVEWGRLGEIGDIYEGLCRETITNWGMADTSPAITEPAPNATRKAGKAQQSKVLKDEKRSVCT